MNPEFITILKRGRQRLNTLSEIAQNRKQDRLAKEMFEEAAAINALINLKETIIEIVNSYHDDKQCCCDIAVNHVCDVCVALETIVKQIEEI